jgi:glycosyltransferase involved in cell wall biosynthesis
MVMIVVHLTSSRFFGGPERQMLGLAHGLACRSVFLSFAEGGNCQAFLEEARLEGFSAHALEHDTPHWHAAVEELTGHLHDLGAEVLCCNGYKANLLGRTAARRARIPVVAISRGWTRETWKVRLYETVDRLHLRWMDRVVCVSEGQAAKVRKCGVQANRIVVIRNAIQAERFDDPEPDCRDRLLDYFTDPPDRLVGAVGRLSREKGFGVLVDAAREIANADPKTGFILFGDGRMRPDLVRRIADAGLSGRFVLAGFRNDLDSLLPGLDALALSSFTEGLPNVVLEAFAAGVPVVATAVGGTPEVVEDGINGYLVPPGNAEALARRLRDLLASEERRRAMGRRGRRKVREAFSFETQARAYARLFADLTDGQVDVPTCAATHAPMATQT